MAARLTPNNTENNKTWSRLPLAKASTTLDGMMPMFQELVYGAAGLGGKSKPTLRYQGTGQPFTLVVIPEVGPVRGFPRGLDVMSCPAS